MLSRKENGKLSLSSLDLQILFGDLYEKCKTTHEVDWLSEQLVGYAESMQEERNDEIDSQEELNT